MHKLDGTVYIEHDGDEEDHMIQENYIMQENHMMYGDVTGNDDQFPSTTGNDEPDYHDNSQVIQPALSGEVIDDAEKSEVCNKLCKLLME